jgi:hypothetical protein
LSTEVNEQSIGSLVRKAEQDFINGNITLSKYVQESPYDDLAKIDAYLNSKHTSGDKDTLNRDKPFFNIVLAARNIWFRATDIDRKNIRIKATKAKELVASFLATIHLQEFMKKEDFGTFLNTWGLYLASYNSAICKFVEQDGHLHAMVMDWQKMIVDFIDFDSNAKIEILELTEAQLRQRKGYDQDQVDALCRALSTRETPGKQKKDNKSNYIRLYEVHGNLPLSYLTGKEEDEYEYVQQMHVISFVAGKQKGRFDDYTLVSGREKQDPYMLTSLIKSTDGSISLNGSVKNLFEAQWMQNHTVKAIKDQLDLASKLIFQTNDSNFANKNALSAIESGDIMVYALDRNPLTQLQNNSHDITSLQNFGQQWKNLAQEITSTPDILEGKNMPSGTAFRQAAIIQQESHSNFEIMIENKGLAIEQMLRRYIIPFLKKQMDTSEEISATLESHDITKIDQMYIPNEAVKRFNRKAVEAVLNDEELPSLDQEMQGVKSELSALGNQRFIKPSEISSKTWKEAFKDLEWEVECEISGESTDKQAVMDTLTTLYGDIVRVTGNPNDPNAKLVYNKILSETQVVSPLELSTADAQPQPLTPAPQPAPVT